MKKVMYKPVFITYRTLFMIWGSFTHIKETCSPYKKNVLAISNAYFIHKYGFVDCMLGIHTSISPDLLRVFLIICKAFTYMLIIFVISVIQRTLFALHLHISVGLFRVLLIYVRFIYIYCSYVICLI